MRLPSFPLKVHIATLVVGILVVTSAALTWVSNQTMTEQMLVAGEELFERIAATVGEGIEAELNPAKVGAQILANSPIADADSLKNRQRFSPALLAAMKSRDSFISAYVGTQTGTFLQMRHLYGEAEQKLVDAPTAARYMFRSVARGAGDSHEGARDFFSQDLALLATRTVKDDYDPRSRPWYRAALAAPKGADVVTAPYIFALTGEVGITVAVRQPEGASVVGVDITLLSLSKLLADFREKKGVNLVLFQRDGSVIAHPDPTVKPQKDSSGNLQLVRLQEMKNPQMNAVWQHFGQLATSATEVKPGKSLKTVSIDRQAYFIRTSPVLDHGNVAFFLGALTPVDDLIAPAVKARNRALLITFAAILVMIFLALRVARDVAEPMADLTREAGDIARFHFETGTRSPSLVAEVQDMGVAVDSLRLTIRRFLDISSALGAEGNFGSLLDRILMETQNAAGATGGGLLLVSADGKTFNGGAVSLPHAPGLQFADLDPHHLHVDHAPTVASCIRDKVMKSYRLEKSAPGAPQHLLGLLGVDQCDTVALPLIDRNNHVLGVLVLYWADGSGAAHKAADEERLAFVQALSGTAAVALANQQLISQQKQLLQSFIELIAGAIDAKSPYTGGHCQRVPELTKMLARAAQAQTKGPFAEFKLSEDQWEALHIAAWLHDCGKVTTPEYVVDKSTKLETVYDRIHEIRMRFELVKAQTEIATLREALQLVGQGGKPEALFDALQVKLAEMDVDWAFVAQCNVGGEFMAPAHVERLAKIAQIRWSRTLDDRLGLAHEELQRKQGTPAPQLPVAEPLLSDRPEHLIARPERERLNLDTAPNNPWGFAMETPQNLYNRGELYNLSISRGTLTAEDRHKINDHIVQTIKMLSSLPFPKHLSEVPEIAGGHHEKMDGTGYPKRLKRAQMSVPARMMAVADIFEALTAVDRPYKKGKLLSEAIKIMGFMVKEQHVDPDIFALFLRSGIHLDYARRFMKPAQIDAVNVEETLKTLGLAAEPTSNLSV